MLEGAERELIEVAGASCRLADPPSKVAGQYAAVVIDSRPSFSLITEMGLLAATDAIVPVEPRYLETVGLMSVIGKINDIRDGSRQTNLRISGLLVTKRNTRPAVRPNYPPKKLPKEHELVTLAVSCVSCAVWWSSAVSSQRMTVLAEGSKSLYQHQ
jgi:hypothetical protein